jgi:hypothetical protein
VVCWFLGVVGPKTAIELGQNNFFSLTERASSSVFIKAAHIDIPGLHGYFFSIARKHSSQVINLCNLMPDHKMVEAFFVQHIKDLKRPAFTHLGRCFFDIGGKNIAVTIHFA